jgi:biuret amidohydrolase
MLTFTHHNPEMQLEHGRTALVLADIQNEFLSDTGSYYPLIEDALKERNVIEHLEQLLQCAQDNDYFVVHSPLTSTAWPVPEPTISSRSRSI